MTVARFDVIGRPAPQGSKKAFIVGGRAVMVEASQKGQRMWRSDVADAAILEAAALGRHAPLSGPLEIEVEFRLPVPKARAKAAPCWHAVSPDLSKLIRATEDALKDGGLIVDDRLIASIRATAVEVADWTGARITVRQLDPAVRDEA